MTRDNTPSDSTDEDSSTDSDDPAAAARERFDDEHYDLPPEETYVTEMPNITPVDDVVDMGDEIVIMHGSGEFTHVLVNEDEVPDELKDDTDENDD